MLYNLSLHSLVQKIFNSNIRHGGNKIQWDYLLSIFLFWFALKSVFTAIIELNLEKAMATHSSTLVWKIPWMEEPGGLQSMGSQRVGHNRVTSLVTFNHQFLLTRRRQAFSGHPLVQWPHHIVFIHLPLGSLFLREIGKIQTFSMAIKHTPLTLLLLLLLLSHVSRVRLCATP